MIGRRTWRARIAALALGSSLASAAMLAAPLDAAAQDAPSPAREAAKHFERGVALYREMDYAGALVEFKRANALAPNPTVLYNIGQAQYQLQDYAAALTTFTRYLAEASPADGHRAEVEGTIDVLRSRVGHVAITTVPAGADVSIDDQPVGRTPLEDRVLVSVGRRKVTATMAGHVAASRFVEVAADDNVPVSLELPTTSPSAPPLAVKEPPAVPPETRESSRSGSALVVVGWVATGVLAAGAITSGALALTESHDLQTERNTFPASSAALNHDSKLTLTYSILADSLGAAAIVVGGVTLYATIASATSHRTAASVSLGPGSARFALSF
jgi:tetratricopeptide (TPR) repeat protein